MSYTICGRVIDSTGSKGPIVNAVVSLHEQTPCTNENSLHTVRTNEEGKFEFTNLEEKTYQVYCSAFGVPATQEKQCNHPSRKEWVELELPLGLTLTLLSFKGQGDETEACSHAVAGRRVLVRAESGHDAAISHYEFIPSPDGAVLQTSSSREAEISFAEPGPKTIEVRARDKTAYGGSSAGTYAVSSLRTYASESDRQMIGGNIGVRLERTRVHPTRDQALWVAIRNRTHAISFSRYSHFINRVLQTEEREHLDNPLLERKLSELGTNLHGVGAYEVLKIATEAAFPIDRICLELTESAIVGDVTNNIAYELKEMGCQLALDDFGTGYSGLRHLQGLPFDVLKVDRSFVGSMTTNKESRKIVAAIVGLGQSLGIETVAEGIETEEQDEMLLWLGCDYGQGWLYGRPVPAAEIPGVLALPRTREAPQRVLKDSSRRQSLSAFDLAPATRLAQLRAVYDGAPVGLAFVDRELRFVTLNKRLAAINHLPMEAMLGRGARPKTTSVIFWT